MNRSLLLEHLEAAGARLGVRPEDPDRPAALTMGDVPAAYAAARAEAVLFDQTDRSRLWVRGGEAAAFLHRMLANDVRGIAPGSGNANLLLTPKGKIRFAFDLAVREDGLALDCPPGQAPGLGEALEAYHFTEDVTFEDASAHCAPLEVAGPRAALLVREALGAAPPEAAHGWSRLEDGTILTTLPVAGLPGVRVDAGPERALELWERLQAAGARPAGLVVRDILRVENGVPLFGIDLSEEVYPQEANLADAFSLAKGCFVGQEVVAKIDTYGGLNKRLCTLSVDHDDPLPLGTRLLRRDGDEARDVGQVTSWAYSFRLDTGMVLAYVKRRNQDPGTVFELEGVAGRATLLDVAGPAPAESDSLTP